MTAAILSLGLAPDRAIVIAEDAGGDWSVGVHGDRDLVDVPQPGHRRWSTRQAAMHAAFEIHCRCGIPVIELRGGFLRPLRRVRPKPSDSRRARLTLDELLGIDPLDGAA